MSKPSIPGVLGILNNENKEHFLNMPFRTLTESKKKKKKSRNLKSSRRNKGRFIQRRLTTKFSKETMEIRNLHL